MNDKTFVKDDGALALQWCATCKRENYAFNVLSGVCTWCGKNVNSKENSDEKI